MSNNQPVSYLDFFSQPKSREIVPFNKPMLPISTGSQAAPKKGKKYQLPSPFREVFGDTNFRNVSPRQMIEGSLSLYALGVLTWEEYSMLAFQPELQPDYNQTIGALTGQKAEPDEPRDFIAHWEERMNFEQRYNPADSKVLRRTRHILSVLKKLAPPAYLAA
jgi:hypothetical protein